MKLDSLWIALILVGLVTSGFGLFMTNLSATYHVPIEDRLTSTFGSYNATYSVSNQSITALRDAAARGSSNDFDIIEQIKAALNVIKIVFIEGIPNMLLMITSVGNFLPVPEFVSRGITGILIISVAFALVYLFLRYKNE
jgi:hypothetical protein